ncbi:hypothetical protein PMKS-000740 [Pichia membranifaciens]|uniref:Xylanolytic transcriptional activator regulatory domain-containing protein n=1 Tax=Pichia membranifaciens TaxID=4926 RepID=A0A1Q2YCI3_9ASCO|nr:hypothetical protein PMKS-000740 [Pichia membranifaciens]
MQVKRESETLDESPCFNSLRAAKTRKTECLDSLKRQTAALKSLRPKLTEFDEGFTLDPQHEALPRAESYNTRLVHPEMRAGSVYTKLFNSSLNLTEQDVPPDLALLETFIPDKAEAKVLMDRYRSSVHPIVPILDWQTIFPLYESFWSNKESVSVSFYIIIFTIFYASSVSLFEERCIRVDETVDREELIKKMKFFVGAAEAALVMDDFPNKISLVGLQASTILYTIVRNDCRTDDFVSISTLVRYSQLLELNRDPQNYHHLTKSKDVQLRRLLWWQIYFLDCTTALSTKLSPLIQPCEYDTQLPNEFKKRFNGQYMLDQAIAFANGRFRWAECTNKLLKASFCVKPPSDQTIVRLTREIENLSFCCSSLIQRMLDPLNIMPSEEQFVRFASSMLSTLEDRCFILLDVLFSDQKRVMPVEEVSTGEYPTESKAIDTSSVAKLDFVFLKEATCEKQVHLLSEYLIYGSMPRNAIFVWEVRKYQPIQTLLSLLKGIVLDATDKSFSSTACKMKKRIEVIDQVFLKLSYLSEHTTTLCKQRWKMLKELKDITWDSLFRGESSTNPTPSDTLFIQNHKMPHYNMNLLIESDWDKICKEMADIQSIIDDNINLRVWDDASGHYV